LNGPRGQPVEPASKEATMKTTKLFWQLLVALALLAVPTVAEAQVGPVHAALRGTVLDPQATTLSIVPPRGGQVVLYRDGQAKGWWLQPGIVTVVPNQAYGVIAVRGTEVLFNAAIIARPGTTVVSWENGGSLPSIVYQPPYWMVPSPLGPAGHVGADAYHRPARHHISSARYRSMLARMDSEPTDQGRLAILRAHAKRYDFSAGQARAIVGRLHDARYRTAAYRALAEHIVPAASPSLKPAAALAGAIAAR
jgi:hypothetical protein